VGRYQNVIRIIRTTQRRGKGGNKSGEPGIVTRHDQSSLAEDAAAPGARIRAHWSVEPERSGDSRRHNGCPRLLDVTFGEDYRQARERTAAHKLSILREARAKVRREHLLEKSIRSSITA